MKLLKELLDRALAALPADLRGFAGRVRSARWCSPGSSRVTFDLDLFVDHVAFRAIENVGFTADADERGLPRIMIARPSRS